MRRLLVHSSKDKSWDLLQNLLPGLLQGMLRRAAIFLGITASLIPSIVFSGEIEKTCLPDCKPKEDTSAYQLKERKAVAISFYMDNDSFASEYKDRDYTAGFALTFSGANAARHPFSIDKALSWINRSLGISSLYDESDLRLHSFETGLAAFTPRDISSPEAIQDDRPYASLIYISNSQQNLDLQNRTSWMSTFSIGVLGSRLAGNLQNEFHEMLDVNEAAGWRNQISDGGELSFKYSLTRQKHHYTGNENFQITTATGFSAGYLTEAFYGGSLRIGVIRTPWWSFNVHSNNYGDKSDVTAPISKSLDEFYFIAGANLRVRAYSAFLQGQFRESTVSYSAGEVQPIVYEGWIGFGCEFSNGARMSYIVRHQSSEVKVGKADREFTYGELNLSYRF